MIEHISHPITISIGLLILGVLFAVWFNAKGDRKKKVKEFGKKTMRLLRRKALRKSLRKGDWDFK